MKTRTKIRLVLFVLVALSVAALAAAALRVGPAPALEVRPAHPAIGRSTAISIEASEPSRGVSRVVVDLIQNGHEIQLADERGATLPGWKLFGFRDGKLVVGAEVGREKTEGLVEGTAMIRVTATGAPSWWRSGRTTRREVELPVIFTPPSLQVTSIQTYVAQGGSEAVVYRVGPTAKRSGVRAGDLFFPGYPLPGGAAEERFALFAAPWDLEDPDRIELVAEDEVGNERRVRFVDRFQRIEPHHDDIQISDAFIDRVVPAILEASPSFRATGDRLQDFLTVNRDIRAANARELAELGSRSTEAFLWKAPFLALPGGQVMSSFADRRTYYYGGREVDRQTHLGFDLASVSHADVPASNGGLVVLAGYFGIYGNTVVVDHGYGLMSLYAHLSSIDVAKGDRVERGTRLGQSGATGLAGGDHLHFSFLLHGVPVRPIEWWDGHWIEDRLKRKLGNSLPFQASTGSSR
ncbi:MAG: M23 family metallopeptidase [Acidobacteria bacterium]|nr:M23 family metallopeptidase [Acidobacteriota bacterium]